MLRLTTMMLFLCLVLFQLSETKSSKSSIVSKSRIKSIKKGKCFKGKTNPKGSEIKWRKQATTGRRRRSGKRKTKRLKIRKRNRNARSLRQKLNWCKNKKRKCWRKNSNRKKKKRNKRGRGEVKRKNGSKKGQKKERSAGLPLFNGLGYQTIFGREPSSTNNRYQTSFGRQPSSTGNLHLENKTDVSV